ncbi:MAG: formate dehydrogenase accessory protein FdhE [Chloroflexi bacterium]|nr:formate dehydrogenase accessory protein FdhE [Chloroflexota bacterium]
MIGYDRIREKLYAQAANRANHSGVVAYWLAMLALQARAEPRRGDCETQASQALARLKQWQPILCPAEIEIDRMVLATLCHRICLVTANHFPEWAPTLEDIRDWLCHEYASLANVAERYLDQERIERGREHGAADLLLAFVFNQALHPTLRKYAKSLGAYVDASTWYRPRCPVCGGKPDFGAFEKETGARRLICSRCDFEWTFWRSACPLCGCDDPDQLTSAATDAPAILVSACAKCGGALRMMNLRQVHDEHSLVVERNLRLTLDLVERVNRRNLIAG